jgi:hypothetical protein
MIRFWAKKFKCVSEHLKQESTSKIEIYTMISMGEQNLNDVANF